MNKQNVHVVIGNSKTFRFDGFDNDSNDQIMVLLLSVSNVFGAHPEYLRKNSSPLRARKFTINELPTEPQKL